MRLSNRARAVVESCTGVLGLALFAVVAWRSLLYADEMRASGEVSMTLQLPYYIVIYLIAASFAVLTLVQLVELFKTIGFALGRSEDVP